MYKQRTLLSETLTAALTGVVFNTDPGPSLQGVRGLAVQANFTYGSGGTTAKAYVQTSLDGGVTWMDVMAFAFAQTSGRKIQVVERVTIASAGVPTDGTMTDDTALAILGDRLRVKVTSVGIYADGTTLVLSAVPIGG